MDSIEINFSPCLCLYGLAKEVEEEERLKPIQFTIMMPSMYVYIGPMDKNIERGL